ncbi:MAG TPA: hypothetical protein VHW23_45725 [Kofleriaceae bacterium]|jgi:hypothetical protein|nr:hypothetical protein [Kofleriaceae bacterium]
MPTLHGDLVRARGRRCSCGVLQPGRPRCCRARQFFTYTVSIWDFGPLDPAAAFTIVFFGAKNGVTDIPASGEQYPGTFGYGDNVLTGYQNLPSGAVVGNYIRWALIYDRLGNLSCVTNAVNVTLQ